jgi:UDP-GlcNAc:undecaprenyl-phosphate/decaprenyl-phosphate GlcNAc-1-phosphate transferase
VEPRVKNILMFIILTFITSFFISFLVTPLIVKFSKKWELFDVPNARKLHINVVPTLGGIGLFLGILISLIIWSPSIYLYKLLLLQIPISILFVSGLFDDLFNLSYRKKLFIQILTSLIFIYLCEVRITSFYGFFGIDDIDEFSSYIVSSFVIIVIINSVNLVDGIDGLASTLCFVASTIFGFWFFVSSHYQYAILATCTSGSLLAFFWYNKSPAKIFMGDTGSSILGSIVGVLAIEFIELNGIISNSDNHKIQNVPVVAMSVLIIPLFDTARVFIVRILSGSSPFVADKKHIHHLLIDLGFTHTQIVLLLLSLNLFIVSVSFMLKDISGEVILFIVLSLCTLAFMSLHNLKSSKAHKKNSRFLEQILKFINSSKSLGHKKRKSSKRCSHQTSLQTD